MCEFHATLNIESFYVVILQRPLIVPANQHSKLKVKAVLALYIEGCYNSGVWRSERELKRLPNKKVVKNCAVCVSLT